MTEIRGRRRLVWRIGEVIETRPETPRTRSLSLDVPGWEGHKAGQHVDARPRVFVCGPTPLVETVATALVELGHDPARVKAERFGPTGG